jgi:hypothetical protein
MCQYNVSLPFEPDFENSGYALWILSPWDINTAIKTLTSVKVRDGREAVPNKYHPTSIPRIKGGAAPLMWYLKFDGHRKCKALYHGVGRDEAGMRALRARGRATTAYDPYHPDSSYQVPPEGPFDEINTRRRIV